MPFGPYSLDKVYQSHSSEMFGNRGLCMNCELGSLPPFGIMLAQSVSKAQLPEEVYDLISALDIRFTVRCDLERH